MRATWKKSAASVLGALSLLAASSAAPAAEFKLSDEAGLTAGIGLRTSFQRTESGAPNGTSDSNDFVIDNARLFFSGHYGKIIKGTLNTDYKTDDSVRIMDAYVGFEFTDTFNIWLGRFLPPQDRANGYGPFYALPWSYPGTVSGYPQIENGRDNGAAVWGKVLSGKLVYAAGAFEGHNKAPGWSGASDKLAYSGRLIAHLWDPEPAPAYLAGGWFGGAKDLLSLGLGAYTQQDGVGSAAAPGKLQIWNVDALFEKKFSGGVPTLEGAYYKYKLGAVDCNSGEPGGAAGACAPLIIPAAPAGAAQAPYPANTGGMADGKAWLVGAGFLFPQRVGWGQFQPYYRYQRFERTLSASEVTTQDFGVNYVIKGPNAKVTAQYTKMEDTRPAPDTDLWRFILGVQLVY